MKKFITQAALAVAALTLSMGLQAQTIGLAKNAPETYTVVKGDTLWDIAGRFLQQPWRWPQIWDMNRESINDPHWIYPGDIIYMDLSGPHPRLRLGKPVGSAMAGANGLGANGANGGPGKLSPRIRTQSLSESAIQTFNTAAIDAFLNRPLIVDEQGLKTNPRIVATQEGRVYLSRGDLAYVRGIENETVSEWHVYRPAKPLLDPDTRKPIAYEALYVGTAQLEKFGDPSTFRVSNTSEEVGVGDRLMPASRAEMINMSPRAPEQAVSGRIVSVYRGVNQVGRNSVIAINRGSSHGLDVGHVLAIELLGRVIADPETKEAVKLPDESVGHMIVFRVFDNIAYGLVMEASKSISIGDKVVRP